MQKVNRLIVALAVVVSMAFAGNAFALNATDHVSVAPNGKGDVLIFPAYFTGSGWETKLVVTNTSMTDSVVAKVVIRSKERSQELRDFFIYLSPADVWTGTLYMADDGRPHIMSTDDSCLATASTFASESNPFDIDLVDTCAGDTNELGYVNVVEACSFDLAPNRPGVLKSAIKTAFDAWFADRTSATADSTINVLAGQEEISNSIASIEYSLNATVLKNHGRILSDPMTVAQTSNLGDRSSTNNSIAEIEAALAKTNIVVPYYAQELGSVFGILTFPTKQADFPCGTEAWNGTYAGFPTPRYSMSAFDLMENTVNVDPEFVSPFTVDVLTLPSEVNFISVNDLPGTFDEGWLHLVIDAGTTTYQTRKDLGPIYYTGAPVIASSMRFDSTGKSGWLYNAYTDGQVDLDGDSSFDSTAEEMNYHYWAQEDPEQETGDTVNN